MKMKGDLNDFILCRFDLQSPSRKDSNLQMCMKVEETLIKEKLYVVPVIYFKDNVKSADK
jgi:hypothetical protein